MSTGTIYLPDQRWSDSDDRMRMAEVPSHSPRAIEAPLLSAAEADLRQVQQEAREEGYPVPSEEAVEEVHGLLDRMYKLSPRRFEVYPTPDGEIALDASGDGTSVIILREAVGTALCLLNLRGEQRMDRVESVNNLPNGFVRTALDELE